MLISTGLGFLAPVIWIASLGLCCFLVTPKKPEVWPFVVSGVACSLVIFVVGRWLNRNAPKGIIEKDLMIADSHSFTFLRMEYWAALTPFTFVYLWWAF